MTVGKRLVSTAALAHLRLVLAWQSAALPLPPTVCREEETIVCTAAQQRCADENVSVDAHWRIRGRKLLRICACVCGRVCKCGQRGRVRKHTLAQQRMHLQAYTQRPWQTQTLPYVKLWTVVSRLPTPPMVRLDTDPLQTQTVFLAKVKMFASTVRTSLVCSGRHQSRWLRPCRVINDGLIKLRTRLWSLRCTVKAWVCVMHVNFNFPFKSGPKVGLHIVQEYIIFEFLRYICRISTESSFWLLVTKSEYCIL